VATRSPVPLLLPDWPDLPASVGAAATLRAGGVSPAPYHGGPYARADAGRSGGGLNLGVHVGDQIEYVRQNRLLLSQQLPGQPAWLSQVHGTDVVDAGALAPGVPQADASFATARGAVCAVMTADCLPVLFAAADGSVVAAAHAGWRGLAAGVLQRTVEAMRTAGAGNIVAWLGPAIGPAQFEVGADVLDAFIQVAEGDAAGVAAVTAAFVPRDGAAGKYLADIYALARLELRKAGITSVAGGNCCTVSDPLRFYSYRRDGVTGRQASLIWRK
jgi:YfiH family protein